MFNRNHLMDPGGGPSPAKNDPTLLDIKNLIGEVRIEMDKKEEKFTASIEDMKKVTQAAERVAGEANKKASAVDAYCKEVEAKIDKATAATGSEPSHAALRAAIPERHQQCLARMARTTMKPEKIARMVAMESWLKNAILLHNPAQTRRHASMLEEMDRIEKALGFEPVQKAALQEDTNTEGGYLVPAPVEAEVLRLAEDAGLMRNLCRIFPMTTKSHLFPNLATNLTVNLTAEEGTISTQEPTFGQRVLTAKKFTCRSIISMELVQDAAIGVISLLMELLMEKYALKEDQQVLEGTGAGSEFTGVNAVTSSSSGPVVGSVNEVFAAGGSAGNGSVFTPAQVMVQKWRARKQASRRGSAWIFAPEILQQIEQFRVDAASAGDKAGGFLYQPYLGGPNAGAINGVGAGPSPDGMLHGFPAYGHSEIAVNRTVGSATNCSVGYFGPWKAAVIIGDLLGLTFGVSEHTQWATGQLDLRMIKRTAGLVAVPEALTKQTGLKIA